MEYLNEAQLDELREYLPNEIEPARNHKKGSNNGYVCPVCGSGHKSNHTGAVSMFRMRDGSLRWKCKSCSRVGDVFNYVGYRDNLTPGEALEWVWEKYNPLVSSSPAAPSQPEAPSSPSPQPQAEAPMTNYSDYLRECAEAFPGSDGEAYMLSRGFTRRFLWEEGIGYDWKANRVTIPYPGMTYYVARAIDKGITDGKYLAPAAKVAGPRPLYGTLKNLSRADVLFITEGELDALSFMQAGEDAVAIGGDGGINRLISALTQAYTSPGEAPIMLVTMDADEAGKKATEELRQALHDSGYICACYKDSTLNAMYGGGKDANEGLMRNAESFRNIAVYLAKLGREDFSPR